VQIVFLPPSPPHPALMDAFAVRARELATAEAIATKPNNRRHENAQAKVGVTPLGFLRCPLLFDT
jgi:hypothetical protein